MKRVWRHVLHCVGCGAEFRAARSDAKWCSSQCRGAAWFRTHYRDDPSFRARAQAKLTEYRARPEVRERLRVADRERAAIRRARPGYQAAQRERIAAWCAKPEVQVRRKAYNKAYYATRRTNGEFLTPEFRARKALAALVKASLSK